MPTPAAAATLSLVMLLVGARVDAGAEPTTWQVVTEPVTRIASGPGNIASSWGYHQPMIGRHGERVYCALLEPHGEGFAQHWSLHRRDAGGWQRRWSSPSTGQLNQPPSLVVDDLGGIHVFAWPDGLFTHWRFAAGGEGEPIVDRPPSPYDDLWPYAAAAVNERGELLVVASSYPQSLFAVQTTETPQWRRGRIAWHPERPDSPSGYDRQAYPLVAFCGRQAHVFTTQDVVDPVKIAAGAGFVYSFRNLQYYHTPDILAQPCRRLTVADTDSSSGWVHNDDLLVDRNGRVHLLYQHQVREGDWGNTRTIHAFGPAGGPLQHVQLGAPGAFNGGRLWESADGTLHAVLPRYTALQVAPLDLAGGLAAEPASLGVASNGWGYYGRVFLAAGRAASAGAPVLEGLYFVESGSGQSEVRYFRATPAASTLVPSGWAPSGAGLRLYPAVPNPFNGCTAIRVDASGPARLAIVDLLGRPLRSLAVNASDGGSRICTWDGRDDSGHQVASGPYLLRLDSTAGQRLGKVTLVK